MEYGKQARRNPQVDAGPEHRKVAPVGPSWVVLDGAFAAFMNLNWFRAIFLDADPEAGRQAARDLEIASDPFSAIMMVAGWILGDGITGITDASTTRKPSMPRTRNSGSTTEFSSSPIRQVPQG